MGVVKAWTDQIVHGRVDDGEVFNLVALFKAVSQIDSMTIRLSATVLDVTDVQ